MVHVRAQHSEMHFHPFFSRRSCEIMHAVFIVMSSYHYGSHSAPRTIHSFHLHCFCHAGSRGTGSLSQGDTMQGRHWTGCRTQLHCNRCQSSCNSCLWTWGNQGYHEEISEIYRERINSMHAGRKLALNPSTLKVWGKITELQYASSAASANTLHGDATWLCHFDITWTHCCTLINDSSPWLSWGRTVDGDQ